MAQWHNWAKLWNTRR